MIFILWNNFCTKMVPILQTVFIWQGIIFFLSFHMKPYLKNIAKNWRTFKTRYLFTIYQFNHMYHILLSISYLLSYYFWKSINKWRNGGDLKLGHRFCMFRFQNFFCTFWNSIFFSFSVCSVSFQDSYMKFLHKLFHKLNIIFLKF